MSTLDEVITRIRAVLELSTQARQMLTSAGEALDQANMRFTQTFTGSRSPEAKQVLASLIQGKRGVDNAYQLLGRAEANMRDYLHKIGATATGEAEQRPDHSAGGVPIASIEQLRGELPPPVTRGTGQKTHGRWIAPDGSARPAVSGRDEQAERVNEILSEMGCPTLPVVAATDVELKLAALMRDRGQADPGMRHVTIVINHRPCKGRLGCEGLVPVVLPEGYSLTVHAPNYRKRFTGGAKPWWR
ncbi:MAG TPA: DddA-like double-stranded DNA deaminase toxin [Mycobacterium sp.]|nr:DddA-like double-stranded DNA deaminase toxin [Mycobacterium sp.]